jgi:hypothetical protein
MMKYPDVRAVCLPSRAYGTTRPTSPTVMLQRSDMTLETVHSTGLPVVAVSQDQEGSTLN